MAGGTRLDVEPPEDLQRKIVSRFWRKAEDTIRLEEYVSYFFYYNNTCRALYLGAIRTESMAIVLHTHEDVLDLIDEIWSLVAVNPNFTRPELRESLAQREHFKQQPQFRINNSINLALRLWVTIRIQDADFGPASRTLQWDDSSSIKDFILRNFPGPRLQGSNVFETMLESNFTAVNLYRMCGIHIEWICQLEDHLKFDIERRVLMIYSLAGCLQDHLDRSAEDLCLSLFPKLTIFKLHYPPECSRSRNIALSQHSLPQLGPQNRKVPSQV
jgi:hypothetical protein